MTQPVWNRPADKVRANAEAAYERIRGQAGDLRPEAVQRGLAKVYTNAKSQLDTMAGSAPNTRAPDLAAAKRSLYGIDDITQGMTPAEQAATQMSFRDAQQRASSVGSAAEGHALLQQADQAGDELLARAVGNHSMSGFGLGDVAATYLATRPGKQAAFDSLQKISKPASIATLLEFACPKPSELSHLQDPQIAELAASA